MKTLRELPPDVQAELKRLHQAELNAWMQDDAITAITCRLRWCELYLKSGGCKSPALPHLNALVDDSLRKFETPRELWHRELRSRPLVAITKRRAVVWHDKSGAPHSYFRETLACGHTITSFMFWENGTPPRRRRCAQCGQIAVAPSARARLFVVAAKALVMCLVLYFAIHSAGQEQQPRFWTREQVIGQSVNAGVRIADAALTCQASRRQYFREYTQPAQSCAGIAPLILAWIPTSVGMSYVAHRLHHDRVARLIPYIVVSPSAVGVVWTLSHNHERR